MFKVIKNGKRCFTILRPTLSSPHCVVHPVNWRKTLHHSTLRPIRPWRSLNPPQLSPVRPRAASLSMPKEKKGKKMRLRGFAYTPGAPRMSRTDSTSPSNAAATKT